ncbi:microtubule-associated protein 10-like [Hoplias malabaricus]|uniref:microtubule-associated protein 10-like n=1 Tax=Hoplias malabaricus TaxID=27720 RepID=UPI003461E40D
MADTHQTMCSFELFVEYVRFDDPQANNLKPAVSVRLLDFPTLLICPPENRNDGLSKPEPSIQTRGNGHVYYFNKGKSCLFKINLDSFHTHLSRTPLYTMALDVRDDIPKLMGSSLISLARLASSIKLAVDQHGIWPPAAYGENCVCRLLNLMGENIGTVSLACKMVSLGASLIPHISESKVDELHSKPKH